MIKFKKMEITILDKSGHRVETATMKVNDKRYPDITDIPKDFKRKYLKETCPAYLRLLGVKKDQRVCKVWTNKGHFYL